MEQIISKDGKNYVPYGIEIPDSDKAKSLIQNIGNDFSLELIDPAPDRHNRFHAIITLQKNNQSLQEILLKDGLARIALYDNALPIDAYNRWVTWEEQARDNKKGLWSNPKYTIKTIDTIEQHQFDIIQATIHSITEKKKTVYINFGEDWKTDFTLLIDKKDWKSVAPLSLKSGHKIEVRGWIDRYYGPMIKVTSPYQIKNLSNP